ncbi:iron-sulfur cluster biosynthesis family protein [Halobacillus sp. Marseille-Q1614]|uniref:iron-sulfur cluster biosynthesis family protein n=1 Tax=Halobacillus sp. Marseille-Q1614 TaxID=2709134 RepID=UPI00156E069B|nr:iron-sulfur cluster biosynthesis family protein [Halobacillus sp. Marseille-Q1614]
MKLTITDEALEQLNQVKTDEHEALRLYYDTDGMGCGVNGQPTIRFTDKVREQKDKHVENDQFKVVVDKQQATFFRREMKLDLIKGTFRLSSPEGVLTPIIPVSSVTKEVAL